MLVDGSDTRLAWWLVVAVVLFCKLLLAHCCWVTGVMLSWKWIVNSKRNNEIWVIQNEPILNWILGPIWLRVNSISMPTAINNVKFIIIIYTLCGGICIMKVEFIRNEFVWSKNNQIRIFFLKDTFWCNWSII